MHTMPVTTLSLEGIYSIGEKVRDVNSVVYYMI